jgi:hypothetical protein
MEHLLRGNFNVSDCVGTIWNQVAPILSGFLGLLFAGAMIYAMATIGGPIAIAMGLAWTAAAMWDSYKHGGFEQVWNDFLPFNDALDLITQYENLTPWQRLGKFFGAGLKTLGMVGLTAGAVKGGAAAVGAVGRRLGAVVEGGEALNAARQGATQAGFRPRDTLPLGSADDVATAPRFIPRDRRELEYLQREFLRNPPPWRSIPQGATAEQKLAYFDAQTRPYYRAYNRPWDAVGNRLEVPAGMTMRQVRRETLDAIDSIGSGRPPGAYTRKQGEHFLHFYNGRETGVAHRVYINADANYSPRLMERVVREMVDSGEFPGVVGAKIALPDAAGALRRADSIVIYTNSERASERVLQRLAQYQRENPDMFLDSTPRMTQWHAPGISTGAEPSAAGAQQWRQAIADHLGVPPEAVGRQNPSFGGLRSDAMYFAQEDVAALRARTGIMNEQRDAWYLQQRTDHWLRRFGVDPEQPHRNLPN